MDRACYPHVMAYRDFKDLRKGTVSDCIDKAFNNAKNRKYDVYQQELSSMVYKSFECFDKKSASFVVESPSGSGAESELKPRIS